MKFVEREVVLLVGPQGSGKSTYCNQNLRGHYRISQDDQGQKAHMELFKKALEEQGEIVVDRINHTREQRYRYLSLAKDAGFKTRIVVMNRKFKDCMERVKNRKDHPTLKATDVTTINSALTMYFNQYEYVNDSEADIVERLSPYDPFYMDITQITRGKRVILVGDVHGCYDELMELLEKVKYDARKDVLIFAGDLVDRGPKIREVLEFVKEGYERGLVFTIMSNHEFKYLRYLRGNKVTPTHGLQETIDQVGLNDDYRYWLEELPYVIKFRPDSYIVHAGIIPTKPILNQRKDSLIFTRTFNPKTLSYNDKDAEPFYNFQPVEKDLKLYFGHARNPKFHVSNWAKALDGGCVHGDVLRACVINENDSQEIYEVKSGFTWGEEDDLESQAGSLQPYEDRVQAKLLSKSEKGDLVSYKYTDQCTFSKSWDQYTSQARGIIFNKKTGKLVAKPFDKFFNLGEMPETSLSQLPKEQYECQDKVDGSLGILYYEKDGGDPQVATCGSFHSVQALEATKMLKEKYNNLEGWNDDITLCWEIIYPENKIVCDYGKRRELVLLAGFHKKMGTELSRTELEECGAKYGFPVVEKYDYTIEQMIELQKTLPKDKEGFVVKFRSGFRVKIKAEEYLKLHRVISGIKPLNIWREMKDGQLPESYLKLIPEELIKDVEEIEDALAASYMKAQNEVMSEIQQHFGEFIHTAEFTKTEAKLVGLRIKEMGANLKHSGAVFPFFLKRDQAFEDYIMDLIRPTGNVL